jgi:hypothetical protein
MQIAKVAFIRENTSIRLISGETPHRNTSGFGQEYFRVGQIGAADIGLRL